MKKIIQKINSIGEHMNKMINKKHLLTAASIILMVTMLMTAMPNAQATTWPSTVTNSSNVTNPGNILGTSPDGNYARFNPTSAMLTGTWRVNTPSGSRIDIYGYATGGTVTVDTYFGNPTNWEYGGYIIVTSGSTPTWWYASGSSSRSNTDFGLYTSGSGTLYVDYMRAYY